MIVKKINIGLLGLGTVGSSVVKILSKKKAEYRRNYGFEFNIKKILVKRINAKRNVNVSNGILTTNPDSILNDPEIDTVIEVIGGLSPAKDMILKAIKNKKNVVTGNKHVLSLYGDKIIKEARKNNCYLGFRAAITGSHQILSHLYYGASVKSIIGVFNGTCNFILTEMEKSNKDFPEILEQAKQLGYAEADPSMDIDGTDTAHKVIIISKLLFGLNIKLEDFYVEGIRDIDIQDIQFSKELNYRIKLLGIMKRENNNVDIRVHPALVPINTSLALLKGAENGIQIDDELRGQGGLYAEGAGGDPTASAIITDLMGVANGSPISWPKQVSKLLIKRIKSINCKYYIRFNAINKPGVLANISSILGRFDINLNKVIQKGERLDTVLPIIIISDEAKENDVRKAIKLIGNLNVTKGKTKIIRIEENVF